MKELSVPQSKRKVSETEFLRVARDIECLLITITINKPKRYYLFLSKVEDMSMELYNLVKAGNSVYPECESDVLLRRQYFKRALSMCQSLSSQVDVICEKFGTKGLQTSQVQQLSEMIDNEIQLIKGVLRKDKSKYTELDLPKMP